MKKSKKTFFLRRFLITGLIASFAYISIIFIYQFLEYQKVKEQLNTAYSSGKNKSSALYRLFSIYGEAENQFRLYTVDFDKENYFNYKVKIDTIKYYIDSLAALPIKNNPMGIGISTLEERDNLAGQYVDLKKGIENLIMLAEDSIATFKPDLNIQITKPQAPKIDSVINQILSDSSFVKIEADTIVQKKQGLFKRIFKAKDDTLVSNNTKEILNNNQLDVIQKNIESIIIQNERTYLRTVNNLRNHFVNLRQKERALLQSNYRLLHSLRTGIDDIMEQERKLVDEAKALDLALYKENARKFGDHLIVALSIMLFMLLLLLYYQQNAESNEKRLEEEKEYAARVAEEKTSILANISHEVRSPIQSLMAVIEILKKNDTQNTIDKEYLDSVSLEINLINNSVTDILNLSKLEAGALDIKHELFPIHKVLLEVFSLHVYQAERKKLNFTHDIKIDPKLNINSSSFRIKQIVSNLITNAIKYTDRGQVLLTAKIINTNGKDSLVISVTDTGKGVATEDQKHIFRQYYMTDNRPKVGSYGLGLYISKLLAEQLNGDITLRSILGKGSIFTLKTPVLEKAIIEEISLQYTTADLPKELNMILIDDNQINILYLKHYFKDHPGVRTFSKGAEALTYIENNPIDVVITDLLMPDMNGWEVLKKIRENKEHKNIQVFAFTAETMLLDNKADEQPYKFDAVLTKPLDEHELVSHILAGTKA